MSRATLTERLRYRFDRAMAGGLVPAIALLTLVALTFLVLMSMLLVALKAWPQGQDSLTGIEAVWLTLMHELDTGNVGGDSGWAFRTVMLTVTFGGIFITSALIGIINNAIGTRIDTLRKGRSRVLEEGHVLILGWSAQIFTVLEELAAAHVDGAAIVVVVLADHDSVLMEDEIHRRVPKSRAIRLVCRTGHPTEHADLAVAHVHGAAAIIVLSPETDDPDASVVKSLLAIVNAPDRRLAPYRIIAEIHESSNGQIAALVGRDEVRLVVAAELLSRMAVQTCRQSGLSAVYTELLSFDGNEIYFADAAPVIGRTFGEVLHGFSTATPIGIRRADGRVALRPPMDQRLASGDQVIVLAENRAAARADGTAIAIDESAIRTGAPKPPGPEYTLILGWNRRAPIIVNALDAYAAPGSEVTFVADATEAAGVLADRCAEFEHQTLTVKAGDTTDRRALERMDLGRYHHVIVLGYADTLGPQRADSRTLVTLLHLRDLAEKRGYRYSILGEMCDVRNRRLAEVTRADDFIVSDRIVSLMLVQLAENWELATVFDELFDSRGSEFYLEPAAGYVEIGRAVTIATVVESARRRGEIAIGYRIQAHTKNPDRGYGVRVNPLRAEHVTFSEADQVIVLARGGD